MGLIDRVGRGISDAASGARDAVEDAATSVTQTVSSTASQLAGRASDAVDTAVDTGRAAAQTAQQTASAARVQLDSFTHDAGAVARQAAVETRGAVQSVARRAQGAVQEAGSRVEAQGRALAGAAEQLGDRVSTEVRTGLSQAGGAAREAAEGLRRIEREVAGGVRDLGRAIGVAGREGVRAAEDGLRELGDRAEGAVRGFERGAREILEDARSTAREVINEGERLVGSVADTLDPGRQIDLLDSEGDSVSIHVGGFAEVEVRGAAEGEIEVSRCAEPPGGYDMEVGGSAGIGIVGQLGGSAGAEASAEANAMVNAGGRVTMHFDTRDEAARAARISARMGTIGTPAGVLLAPSADDMRFMAEHTRSVEVRGSVAGEIAGELGVAETLNLEGSASARADAGVRLTLAGPDDEGRMRGPRLTVFSEVGIEASGSAAAGIGVTGQVSGTVRMEDELELPAGVSPEQFLRDPRAAAAQLRQAGGIRRETTLTIEGEASAGGTAGALYVQGSASRGASFEVSASGDPADLARAARRAVQGDMSGALTGLDRATTVKAEVTDFTNTGVSFSPEITAFGVGAGIEAQYEHHDEGEHHSIEGRPSEVAERLRAQLARGTSPGVAAQTG